MDRTRQARATDEGLGLLEQAVAFRATLTPGEAAAFDAVMRAAVARLRWGGEVEGYGLGGWLAELVRDLVRLLAAPYEEKHEGQLHAMASVWGLS